jgi:tetratricopeptide (TPR) repeat protein
MEAWLPKRRKPDSYGLYELLGEILLAEKSYDEVISALKNIEPKKMPWIWNTRYIFGYNMQVPRVLLAKAFKEKGHWEKAIEIYEQLTDPNPENRDGRLIYPRNYYYLAQCYEMKGQRARAARLYKKFLRLWKDADEDRPEVKDARERLAGLK